jgi:proline iminopeptidase
MTPDNYTNEELMLDVGDGHTLYVHDWGRKDAKTPIVFLHGGPGYGCTDKKKNQFDPEVHRVIFFDQRGSGSSLPTGSLEANMTGAVVSDILEILEHFGIGKCILTGGSWGCALAFYFAIYHPERVTALLVDGVYTGSMAENAWLDKGGFQTFFPDAWQRYLVATPTEHHKDPSNYHFKRILGDDTEAAKESGYAYQTLEASAISLDDRHMPDDFETFDPTNVRTEVHYLANGCFVEDRFVFDNAAKLNIPVFMVQGRYDMVCPPNTAYELSQLLPNVKLVWTTSGHATERETWNVKRMLLAQLTEVK